MRIKCELRNRHNGQTVTVDMYAETDDRGLANAEDRAIEKAARYFTLQGIEVDDLQTIAITYGESS